MLLTTGKKKSLILCSLFIFAIIFCLLGIPFTKWGFLHNDFGVIWHSKLQSMRDVLGLFYEKGMSCVVQPSNYMVPEQSFFAVLYRPLVYVIYAIQMLFFNFNPVGYFWVMIFFHALNAVLLFCIFTLFFEFFIAFWASLFFAFHLSLWDWMGWIAGQSHVINLTFILSIVLLFYKYLCTQRTFYYVAAAIFLFISLFYRETAIVLPFWFVLSLLFWTKNKFGEICKQTGLFFLVDIGYLGVRAIFYPFKTTGNGLKVTLCPLDFIFNLKNRFFDVVTFLVDVANLSWLPGNNRLLKGFLLLLFFSFIIWLFYKSTYKKILLFCLISMAMLMWPAFLRYYSSRYLYKALPFLAMFFMYLIIKQAKFYKTTLVIMYGFLGFIMILLPCHFKNREAKLHKIELAFKELALCSDVKDKTLCFVGLPYEYFPSGVAQAVLMHGFDSSIPIYYDTSTFLWSKIQPTHDPLKVMIKDNVIKLDVIDKNNSWFNPFNQFCRMGEVLKSNIDLVTGMPKSLTYILDKKYAEQKLVFITWDYKNWRFKIL